MARFKRPQNSPFISVRNATFRLGDRLVFSDFSWQMGRREQWAIIGANGSGKSLLADALRGRVPLVKGELRYHFRPPPGLSPEEAIGHVAFEDRKSEVHGTVVQSRWMSFEQQSSILVRDFLSYDHVMDINPYEVTDLHDTARPAFERRMRRAIRLLGLREFLSRTLLSLSNGERQRVELAKALSGPLRLLILDEPYTGLDAETRRHFHSFLESLLSTPLRVILITTHLEELPRHITHVIRVEECKVVAAGLRKEILPTAPAGKRLKTKVRKGHSAAVSSRRPVECLVQLRDLTVRYGPRTILDRVSWTIHRGQSWVLLGPNGSGKTTLLSLITGDNPQTYTNDVVVFGKRLGNGQSIWRLKRQIGWLSPELQLHFDDNASVWQVVLSGFRDTIGIVDRPTTAQKKAATYWLKRFGLLKTANLSLFSLSAGSQRMVLLARALVKKPTLLVLDEPCQGLDSAHRELLIRIIDSLIAAKTTTAIFVTHRIEEVPGSITKALRLSPAGKASVEDFDRSRV